MSERNPSRLRRINGRLGVFLLLVGVGLIVETALQHPGGVAIGYLLGGAFVIAGALRTWLARKGM